MVTYRAARASKPSPEAAVHASEAKGGHRPRGWRGTQRATAQTLRNTVSTRNRWLVLPTMPLAARIGEWIYDSVFIASDALYWDVD